MSSDTLKEIIEVGHDLASIKYCEVAVATVLFYDYLLTLADEVEFAWYGRKTWVFGIFLANRYFPMGYQFFVLILAYRPTFSQRVCDKTAFLSILAFTGITLLAQVVLTLRIYAVTGKSRKITACLGVITISQFALGLYYAIFSAIQTAQQDLPIPLGPYRICVPVRHWSMEVGFTTISLTYDLLAFLVIVYLVLRSHVYRIPVPSLLRTIAQDSTHYFLVIFTSHLVFELTLLFGRPSIQVLPGVGNTVYLPVMITRLMLSLKKASSSQENRWSLGEPTTKTTLRFAERQATTGDDIPLDTLVSRGEGTQSQL